MITHNFHGAIYITPVIYAIKKVETIYVCTINSTILNSYLKQSLTNTFILMKPFLGNLNKDI